ncbi:MAG: hypothetical protein DRN90_00670 [Thermoproteota archaeon]|nr:MAG: hypothetical protein DRG83_01250 [Deltaproteobacteria bacterium]RLG49898.1 MAG: hypothetical protein DRN90_00670 [Candidatus Korarchaeota archaeon]
MKIDRELIHRQAKVCYNGVDDDSVVRIGSEIPILPHAFFGNTLLKASPTGANGWRGKNAGLKRGILVTMLIIP